MKRFYWLLFLGVPFWGHAQSSSFENWLGVGLEYELMDPLTAKIKLGYRSTDFYSKTTFIDCILKYKVHKYLRVSLGWRYAGKGDPTNVDAINNRFQLDLSSKIKLRKRLYLKPRLRYQIRFKDWFESPLGYLPKQTLRPRLLLNYDLNKRWSITSGAELFASHYYKTGPYLEAFRIVNGVDYTFKKTHTVGLSYNIEHNLGDLHTAHIIALNYQVNINKVVKRIKKKIKKRKKNKQ